MPIPGTRRSERIAENVSAADIVLNANEIAWLEGAVPNAASGERYPLALMQAIDDDSARG